MRRLLPLLLLSTLALPMFGGTGRIIIVNNDKAGQGFNDPTPVEPIGGNPGTTRGAQRLHVFQEAARKWESVLDTNVDIIVNASFPPIPGCTATEGILGQAAPVAWQFNFPNAPRQNVYYPNALANKLADVDLDPSQADIFVQFNSSVDDATCLGSSSWYYGLDRNHGNDVDLFVVVLHELAHGLGVSGAAGAPAFLNNRPAISDTFRYDDTAGRTWDQMSEAERNISRTNTGRLLWDGPAVKEFAPRLLARTTTLAISDPSTIARDYDIGTASFGTPTGVASMAGRLVLAEDAADATGPATTDGCSAFSNAAAVAGNIAVVDRGTCTFVSKARNAQAAGAVGLVVVDNRRETCIPPGMGATEDASDVLIPVVSVSQADGDTLKAQFAAGVQASLRRDPTQLAGASKEGRVRLYAPCTYERGSSIHHWDVVATPNLLMEPSINSDLTHGVDLTLYQLIDIGWTAQPKSGRRLLKR